MFSCSSKQSLNERGKTDLVLAKGNSVDALFEKHDYQNIKNDNLSKHSGPGYRSPASVQNINVFKDTYGKLTKKVKYYTVSDDGETLMLISFNLYGDFRYWKSLAKLNSSILSHPYVLEKGLKLKYYAPKNSFVYQPSGLPFLIKNGHTLSKISDIVYENWRRWPEIHENNIPLIPDPNKIYAGFTLYYLPDEENLSVNKTSKTNHKFKKIDNHRGVKSPLMKLVLRNISKQNLRKTPKSFDLLKKKLSRLPSSVKNVEEKSAPEKELVNLNTESEKDIINSIKKAVDLDSKRKIEKAKGKGSLLNKVKNSFKQFDYY